MISDGRHALIVAASGSPKRVGGLGDVLAGACGTFAAWTKMDEAKQKKQQHNRHAATMTTSIAPTNIDATSDAMIRTPLVAPSSPSSLLVGAYSAALFCRMLQRDAFRRHRRSMLTSHVMEAIPNIIDEWYTVGDAEKEGEREH